MCARARWNAIFHVLHCTAALSLAVLLCLYHVHMRRWPVSCDMRGIAAACAQQECSLPLSVAAVAGRSTTLKVCGGTDVQTATAVT